LSTDTSRVVVREYTCQWPLAFEYLRVRLLSAVGDIAVAVEHVGSTAVPGLAAKPIIDLDVVVEGSDVTLAIERLRSLGYRHRGDLGIPEREAFTRPPGLPAHNLYVCPKGSRALRNHIVVRDRLRRDPDAAAEYGKLKMRLAKRFPDDIDSYIAGKTDFILRLLRENGFEGEELAEVERMNTATRVELREVEDGDLEYFFRFETEPEAVRMAAFTSKDPSDRAAFDSHWKRIREAQSVMVRTVLVDGDIAGSILSYEESLGPEVCFWIGRRYWGRGVATQALALFLAEADARRPMHARAASDNVGSLRVLEKCGFRIVGRARGFANARGEEIEELVLKLS
jgi:GrpB-like predicted nucleotidyltransferase (UPF0157 family)/RimJ/RimL family protein N-acetyltransferase